MRGWSKVAGLAVLFVAGALLAGAATADTTTETTTTTETLPASTVVTTATVQQTTTRRVIVTTSPTTTSSESSSSSGTPTWVWVLLGIAGAVALVSLIALLLQRGGGKGVEAGERRRRLDGAVSSWAMQGWALDSQSADSAVLRRGGELMVVSVDPAGNVSTRPLPNEPQP